MAINRRQFLTWISASGASAAIAGCESTGTSATALGDPLRGAARVVVVGGGYGGATAAKYVKMWAPDIDVVLVERNAAFTSCPMSNLVLGGNTTLQDITMGYGGLGARGVRVTRDEATVIDIERRQVRLASGATLSYDRVIVSPGVDFIYEQIPGLKSAEAQQRILHAWKAGPQTMALRKQLESMPDGGVYVLQIPTAPYRCPPGPYERVCQVADYFKRAKPRSKILVLDANPDIVSKKGLFLAAWDGLYKGMVEYRPNSELADIDVRGMTVKLQFDNVKGDVINVIPPNRAGDIAQKSGLITANQRWCGIDWRTAESVVAKGVHVIGDSTLSAAAMPKSASMANQHGKIAAASVIALIKGEPVYPNPVIMNTCYSFVSSNSAMHVASVHQYDAKENTLLPAKGGGVSEKASELEATYAWGWARNIWSDTLA
ncbi:MAG: NAD(P)/FAD-dependent oxidoreductase [Pseudomonadota bacterium]